jgi:hypothetical protein
MRSRRVAGNPEVFGNVDERSSPDYGKGDTCLDR